MIIIVVFKWMKINDWFFISKMPMFASYSTQACMAILYLAFSATNILIVSITLKATKKDETKKYPKM